MTVHVNALSPLRREVITSANTRLVLATGALSLLMALGAAVRLPLSWTPVPVTLQVFFLFYGAMALGRRSVWAQAGYLSFGAAGLPVFTGLVGGFAALTQGVTLGYLAGFVIASWVIGSLMKDRALSITRCLLVGSAGLLACYIPGVLWLKSVTGISWGLSIHLGAAPFIIFDILKIAAAFGLYRLTAKRISVLFK
ncbi:MAG TPA: biotin transporter BioY [Candidatus Sumerlaeota bacterium]|nr:biotin transporter BioY [Candidatus Sumerlaeota bacterium]